MFYRELAGYWIVVTVLFAALGIVSLRAADGSPVMVASMQPAFYQVAAR